MNNEQIIKRLEHLTAERKTIDSYLANNREVYHALPWSIL